MALHCFFRALGIAGDDGVVDCLHMGDTRLIAVLGGQCQKPQPADAAIQTLNDFKRDGVACLLENQLIKPRRRLQYTVPVRRMRGGA